MHLITLPTHSRWLKVATNQSCICHFLSLFVSFFCPVSHSVLTLFSCFLLRVSLPGLSLCLSLPFFVLVCPVLSCLSFSFLHRCSRAFSFFLFLSCLCCPLFLRFSCGPLSPRFRAFGTGLRVCRCARWVTRFGSWVWRFAVCCCAFVLALTVLVEVTVSRSRWRVAILRTTQGGRNLGS